MNLVENQSRLIFPNKIPRNSYSCWNNKWASEYESPWSLLTKFSFINKISSDEMLREYGIIQLRSTKGKIGDKHKSLYTLSGFDDERINKALKRSLTEENENLLESLLRATTNSQYTKDNSLDFHFMRFKVTFCPICIKDQYHSTLHQFHFIQKCPFHLVPLKNRCPDCQRSIPYIFDDSLFQSPFKCTCGYQFAQMNIRIEESGQKTIKDKYLSKWIYSRNSYRERFNNLIILEELRNQEENFKISLSDMISSFQNSNSTITTKQIIYSERKKQIFKLKKPLRLMYWNNPILKELPRDDLDYQCNQLFNSIARHLRKGILKKNLFYKCFILYLNKRGKS